jgi:lactoylglutathione lyase
MDVLHTAIWVSDLEAMKAFYCDGVGLSFSREFTTDGVRNYFVTGEGPAEIQFKYDPEHNIAVDRDGIDHLAVGVDDVEAMVEHLEDERESEVIKPPTVLEATESTIAFVTDPDGYMLELIQSA